MVPALRPFGRPPDPWTAQYQRALGSWYPNLETAMGFHFATSPSPRKDGFAFLLYQVRQQYQQGVPQVRILQYVDKQRYTNYM